jgi:hypothetical protein
MSGRQAGRQADRQQKPGKGGKSASEKTTIIQLHPRTTGRKEGRKE